jgi:hypothetical protein
MPEQENETKSKTKGTHRSGNTPYLSCPTTDSPAMANDLALSPSVRISVHSWLVRVPASLASLSLVMPVL